jgi:EAL domain-containing protein (putative c-di-GMP-specific phosphodiesterase class I)
MRPRDAALWPIGSVRNTGVAPDLSVGLAPRAASPGPDAVWENDPRGADIQAELRSAIEAQQFLPFYQPVIAFATGELLGFECLARWSHPRRGLLGPDCFITAAEESGQIGDLSYALLDRAVRDARTWPAHLRFSINVSPVQLQDSDLPLHILRRLHEGGIEPHRLTVELTESRPVADMPMARRVVSALRDAGIKVVLDDFGSGSASLLCLHHLPFDGLKVDRSFLVALDSENGRMIIRAVVDLARSLGMSTVIEGIETPEQLALLQDMGFDRAQGFLFGRPMPAAAAARMIAKRGLKRLGVR